MQHVGFCTACSVPQALSQPAFVVGGGGPIRSRLVADGSLPEELPAGAKANADGAMVPELRRGGSWRHNEAAAHLPNDRGERWNGPTTPVSVYLHHSCACCLSAMCANDDTQLR